MTDSGVSFVSNYQWLDGTSANKTVSWTISKAEIKIPTVTDTFFEYDGNPHAPTISTGGNVLQAGRGDFGDAYNGGDCSSSGGNPDCSA